ncbi:GILT-like protein 1 [Anthonomus grandis grandis]|uniref:GILT-like protein 1 n=1 Tax=Anthonomus grandis grandis TaxID=2921223 RepID=UPI0021651E92|nr:GILT-like protein 1 [Anthonomus grandis grandis]
MVCNINTLNKNCVLVIWILGFCLQACLASVNVSVYYETLCPDCINFITTQLHPTYLELGDQFVHLDFIPYGNTKEDVINGTTTFICQHGPKECFGNEIHGCVVYFERINVTERFINCAESAYVPTSLNTFKDCANKYGVSWARVEHCNTSGLAEKILGENGARTKLIQPKWVPTIVFNDVFNESDNNEAQRNFKAVVCRYLGNKPEQCSSLNSIKNFFRSQVTVERI